MKALFFLALLLAFPAASYAATMGVSPSTGMVSVGDIVTVRVTVNPSGVAVNNAEAVLRFPAGTLEVLSVSKANSMFTLWVEDPAFSNSAGTISFNAGIPNPGVSSPGTALSVSFHALQAGTASFSLSDAAVRANDGMGTNVLTDTSGARLVVAPQASAPMPVIAPIETSPATQRAGPVAITSPTHPDSAVWYSQTNPAFAWDLPESATAVQLGVDRSASAAPTVSYATAITQKTIDGLEDGVWHFRMRYRSGGVWSAISSYQFRIDSEAPVIVRHDFIYDEVARAVLVEAAGTDSGSGISDYEVSLDGEAAQLIPANELEGRARAIPVRTAGVHRITLTAVDGAGNRTSVEGVFSVPRSLDTQVLFRIGWLEVTLLAVLVGMTLFSLLSLVAALVAWYVLSTQRHRKHPSVPGIRKDMHRRFLKMKSNMEVDIRSLDRARTKRELSREEVLLYRRLIENVGSLEKHLDQLLDELD